MKQDGEHFQTQRFKMIKCTPFSDCFIFFTKCKTTLSSLSLLRVGFPFLAGSVMGFQEQKVHVFPVLDPSQVRDPRELVRWLVEFFGFFFGQTWERKTKNTEKHLGVFGVYFLLNLLGITGRSFFFFFFNMTSALNMMVSNRNLLFQGGYFQVLCYVSAPNKSPGRRSGRQCFWPTASATKKTLGKKKRAGSFHLDVSKKEWVFSQIIHFNRVFHYTPSILGVPLFLETPICMLENTSLVVALVVALPGCRVQQNCETAVNGVKKMKRNWFGAANEILSSKTKITQTNQTNLELFQDVGL